MKKKTNKVLKAIVAVLGVVLFSFALLIGCGFITFDYIDDEKAAEKREATGNMNDFNAETLNGSNFTSEDLKKYDLTMVNIWYTGCKPCVEKMPETQELYKKLPKNVNLVSICADGNENKELANKIVTDSKVTYPALIPDQKLNNSLVNNISVFPTTIFVDKDGNIVGDVWEGSPSSKYTETYLDEVNKRLNMLNK